MKKFVYLALLVPALAFAQEDERKDIQDPEITDGFYGSLTVNQLTSFDETVNGKLTAGMHFSNFHIGVHYLTSLGENNKEIDRIVANDDTKLKYSGFGVDLMYEFDVHKLFSVAPYFNTSFMKYEYTEIPLPSQLYINNAQDNFLNTQIGTKLFFTPNRNFKVGVDVGYNLANDVDLYKTESSDLSGMGVGITIQYNHFNPKW